MRAMTVFAATLAFGVAYFVWQALTLLMSVEYPGAW